MRNRTGKKISIFIFQYLLDQPSSNIFYTILLVLYTDNYSVNDEMNNTVSLVDKMTIDNTTCMVDNTDCSL